jgi:diacylglycerol kinase family enzyme
MAKSGQDFESAAVVNVSILYNEDAGQGISGDSLRGLIERAGHTVLDVVTGDQLKIETSSRPIDTRSDLIVAAGGDGTVAVAAGVVAGTSTPLAILPLGTANNIARSINININASAPELVASWDSAPHLSFDLAYAQTASRKWLVVEGAGGGLMPAGILAAQRAQEQQHEDRAATAAPAAALQIFYDVLLKLEPKHWTMVVDGIRVSNDFLLVEILNIRSIGPNLVFSADASPFDGYLDVVVAGPEHRNELLTYLQHRIEGHSASPSLPHYRAREIDIESCDELHIDDERVDTCDHGEISIRIAPGAITVLG